MMREGLNLLTLPCPSEVTYHLPHHPPKVSFSVVLILVRWCDTHLISTSGIFATPRTSQRTFRETPHHSSTLTKQQRERVAKEAFVEFNSHVFDNKVCTYVRTYVQMQSYYVHVYIWNTTYVCYVHVHMYVCYSAVIVLIWSVLICPLKLCKCMCMRMCT